MTYAKKNIKLFIIIVFSLVAGFLIGVYKDYIFKYTLPIFGIKNTSSNIDLSSVEKTYSSLVNNYDGKIDTQKLIDGANAGLVSATGDDYTIYMTAEEYKEFNNDLTGNIGGGIGAEIGLRNNKATIIRVLGGDPAEKAGLKAGDIIIGVNNDDVSSWSVDKIVSKLRGDVGTTVKLIVLRNNETKTFSVTRQTITSPSVSYDKSGNYGIITINRFGDDTGSLARTAASKLKDEGVQGIILDLRGNGGGYLTAAQSVASLWLNNKVIVTERKNGKITDSVMSDDDAILAGMPTAVLVNGASASASEIVAGALKDYKAATLIGEKTFGKGSVQDLIDLDNGAKLKVTIAKWYTPNGKNINKTGIEPDYKVELTQDEVNNSVDSQLDKAKSVLNK